ncbi:PH domain-containing protein [Streptomyces sp. NPDC057966]|uniref:PH domain-containing protein n=1 Tax=Streptomyces sp. NPDC057966 TaxID=3346292 RepID=UPI0036E3E33E
MTLCCWPGQFIRDVPSGFAGGEPVRHTLAVRDSTLGVAIPALRIDPAGISKVRRVGSETVQWGDIDQVRFNSRQSLLLWC